MPPLRHLARQEVREKHPLLHRLPVCRADPTEAVVTDCVAAQRSPDQVGHSLAALCRACLCSAPLLVGDANRPDRRLGLVGHQACHLPQLPQALAWRPVRCSYSRAARTLPKVSAANLQRLTTWTGRARRSVILILPFLEFLHQNVMADLQLKVFNQVFPILLAQFTDRISQFSIGHFLDRLVRFVHAHIIPRAMGSRKV